MTLTWSLVFLGCFVAAYGNAMNKLAYHRQSAMHVYQSKSPEYQAENKPPTLMSKNYRRTAYAVIALGILIVLGSAIPLSLGYTIPEIIASI